MIDFSAIRAGEQTFADLAGSLTVQDLKTATNEQIDDMIGQIEPLNDDQIVFVVSDPEAEGGIGWNVAHLVAHVTASSEENAAVGSVLARGIAYPWEPRLRTETDWNMITTRAACLQRLEESRRMRLAFLDTWPDQPDLASLRTLPEAFSRRVGPLNAVGTMLLGLSHESGQFAQLRDIIAQAKAATL